MCGIFLYCGAPRDVTSLHQQFLRSQHRGPDDTQFLTYSPEPDTLVAVGFHRLSINGQDPRAHQPFTDAHTWTVCNGEIWNYSALHDRCGVPNASGSDCEVLAPLFRHAQRTGAREHRDPADTMQELCRWVDGVFGAVVYDRLDHMVHIARDRVGIRSLYYLCEPTDDGRHNLWVASELKSLPPTSTEVRACPPGCCATFDARRRDSVCEWTPYWSVRSARAVQQYAPPTCPLSALADDPTYCECAARLRALLVAAVEKRLMSDRPIGCVLSGGLDSTLVTAVAVSLLRARGVPVRTYTIGIAHDDADTSDPAVGVDIYWARRAAEHLGTDHHEFLVTEKEFLDAIPDVVAQIESFDVTTVRASVGNWLLAKHIREVGADTVLLCGDVADELLGGYRGFGLATGIHAFDEANVRMMENVHRFDVLRCEKSFAGHGLEGRVPFADVDLVEFAMSVPPEYKMWGGASGRIEKDLLRRAFDGWLPPDLLWRRKEAFSDGVSAETRSWFHVIQEALGDDVATTPTPHRAHAPPYDAESRHYRELYEGLYGSVEAIPYLWKHPFCEVVDPSARCLHNYTDTRGDGVS